ncbi:hypothetical protein [Nevskia sp.]|uniref:hypothetical protein n=1 Tax=Nevskia sp. TaxID=1929292 RepID=UPI0025FC4FF8|nr:hypothetical protein [Nevskia sp.]
MSNCHSRGHDGDHGVPSAPELPSDVFIRVENAGYVRAGPAFSPGTGNAHCWPLPYPSADAGCVNLACTRRTNMLVYLMISLLGLPLAVAVVDRVRP